MIKKILFVIFLIVILNFTINDSRKLLFIESTIRNTALSVNRIFTINKKVKINNEKALKSEIKELKELLKLNTITSTYKLTNATIIERSIKDYYNIVTIDKGSKNGIKKDQAVVTGEGLIGKTLKVTKNTSQVKLITSSDIYNKISVLINEKTFGILSGYDIKTNSFLVEADEVVKEGDIVTTTGLGNIYPNGVKIGKVVRISKDNFDLSYIVKIDSSVDIKNFHYVAVLDRYND
ncbi:MAG: rod shape-determining protein MreC [Bacilli bacterium]